MKNGLEFPYRRRLGESLVRFLPRILTGNRTDFVQYLVLCSIVWIQVIKIMGGSCKAKIRTTDGYRTVAREPVTDCCEAKIRTTDY